MGIKDKGKKKKVVAIVPISGVQLTEEKDEFKIVHVTLASSSKLPLVIKKFCPRIELRSLAHNGYEQYFKQMLERYDVFAVKCHCLNPKDVQECYSVIQEELKLMDMSRLLIHNQTIDEVSVGNIQQKKSESILIDRDGRGGWNLNWYSPHKPPLRLDKYWENFHNNHFFFKMLKYFRKHSSKEMSKEFIKSLRQAICVCGEAKITSNLGLKFFMYWAVLESLLTLRGEKTEDAIKKRITILFHCPHSQNGQKKKTADKVAELYELRNKLFHEGKSDNITADRVDILEYYLFNIFNHIFNNITEYKSKDGWIRFLKEGECKEYLGTLEHRLLNKTTKRSTTTLKFTDLEEFYYFLQDEKKADEVFQ
jgi:hypothetical protein